MTYVCHTAKPKAKLYSKAISKAKKQSQAKQKQSSSLAKQKANAHSFFIFLFKDLREDLGTYEYVIVTITYTFFCSGLTSGGS